MVDCVWQMSYQFPAAFEFNERLLIKILKSLYSCEHGTFLKDSDFERYEAHIFERTVSLWAVINSKQTQYKNPLYKSSGKKLPIRTEFLDNDLISKGLINLATNTLDMQLWKGYYLYWKNYHNS